MVILACVSCALWAAAALRVAVNAARLKPFAGRRAPEPAAWPALSVIVAARDEADTLEPALASLLAQDYPALEVILVNDRSTDATGAIVSRLAARDPRVVAVHVTALPDGWLGKVHALDQARRRAAGTWLLFTDADVHFAPGVLRRAVALAESVGAGHLSLFPDIPARGLPLRAALSSFALSFFLVLGMRRLGRPRSGVAMGVGAFNLVRADALAATPGFEWLRLEVVDDIALGQMLNRHGVAAALYAAPGEVTVEWYPTLRGMIRGLEKNAFAAMGFSYLKVAAGLLFTGLTAGGLLAAPFVLPFPAGAALAAGAWAAFTVAAAFALGRCGWPGRLALLTVPGLLFNSGLTAWSAFACRRRGGIVWRGTFYPLERLRAGRRLRW